MSNFAKMKLLEHKIPIVEIPIKSNVKLFIKREDLTHPEISGNKYWKMFYNVKKYLEKEVSERKIITLVVLFLIILLPLPLWEMNSESKLLALLEETN